MIGEIPQRFDGAPIAFWERAYFLSTFDVSGDGSSVIRVSIPHVSESAAHFTIGERGWVRAELSPYGWCYITIGVEGDDMVMWDRLYADIERHGRWITEQLAASEDKAADGQASQSTNTLTASNRSVVIAGDNYGPIITGDVISQESDKKD